MWRMLCGKEAQKKRVCTLCHCKPSICVEHHSASFCLFGMQEIAKTHPSRAVNSEVSGRLCSHRLATFRLHKCYVGPFGIFRICHCWCVGDGFNTLSRSTHFRAFVVSLPNERMAKSMYVKMDVVHLQNRKVSFPRISQLLQKRPQPSPTCAKHLVHSIQILFCHQTLMQIPQ